MKLSMTIPIHPMSVNEAWKGKRYKTDAYEAYEIQCQLHMPKIHTQLPPPPHRLYIKFYFSNSNADWDNPIKPIIDIIQLRFKSQGFNDRSIMEAIVTKHIVNKGEERMDITIEHFTDYITRYH